jgi:hypothetical protein
MNRSLVLLLALAAVSGSAEAQCPFGWVPGQMMLWVKDASLDQLNSDGLLRGELRTGLASLDSLIERTGVLSIRPLDSSNGLLELHLLQFPERTDVCAMAALYVQNEHVLLAEPAYLLPVAAVRAASWSLVKRVACGTPAGTEVLPPGGPMAAP